MKEVLLSQRINFAKISVCRNYSRLDDREYLLSLEHLNWSGDHKMSFSTAYLNLYCFENGKSPGCFFPSKDRKGEGVTLKSRSIEYFTTKDKHIKRHFANPFSSISITTLERTIKRDGDKITIKIWEGHKNRGINKKYFTQTYTVSSITFNMKTGNFTTLVMMKNKTMITKKFRTNSFTQLDIVLQRIFLNPVNLIHIPNNPQIKDAILKYDKDVFYCELNKIMFGLEDYKQISVSMANFSDTSAVIGGYTGPKLELKCLFGEIFVKLKKIKAPNDYYRLLSTYYPTEKYLKKNERKLVASILDKYNIKSGFNIKLVHENPTININTLEYYCSMFGKTYTKHLSNIKSLADHLKVNNNLFPWSRDIKRPTFNVVLSEQDKEKIVKIWNDPAYKITLGLFSLLSDHFSMINKIRQHNIPVEFKATTLKSFNEEHTFFVKILRAINQSYETKYVFNEEMVNAIQEPIYDDYYPVLLTQESDYHEEGDYMHHCVWTYTNKDRSIIVSLRHGAKDRVTSEFDAGNGVCYQSRYFSNTTPPEDFKMPLHILKVRIERLAQKGSLRAVGKLRVPIVVEGVTIIPVEDRELNNGMGRPQGMEMNGQEVLIQRYNNQVIRENLVEVQEANPKIEFESVGERKRRKKVVERYI